MPGTTLLKTYKGRDVQVRVLPNSFEFEGEQHKSLTAIARIIQMSWEDRTSFDVIRTQFGLTPGEVIAGKRIHTKSCALSED